MRIRNLRAVGWRNLAPLDLDFDATRTIAVFYGNNGEGKTNVLEALFYLARFRSFRATRALDLVRQGEPESQIGVVAETRDLVRTVDVRLGMATDSVGPLGGRMARPAAGSGAARSTSRVIRVDGKPVRGAANAFGLVSVVLFVPEDLLLVRAAPALRRGFLDVAISGAEPAYFAEAADFQKILSNRNALLRMRREGNSNTWLETYDEQLARAGARIVLRRRQLIAALEPTVGKKFEALHGNLSVTLRYESDPAVADATSEQEVTSALFNGLTERHLVDERRGHTTFGPQTDDLQILLGGRPAREHASQGQLRSLVLAMKLGELEHVACALAETPVLLLDDVSSELDPMRRQFLFETLTALSCQILVTVADPIVVPELIGRENFEVKGGRISAPA